MAEKLEGANLELVKAVCDALVVSVKRAISEGANPDLRVTGGSLLAALGKRWSLREDKEYTLRQAALAMWSTRFKEDFLPDPFDTRATAVLQLLEKHLGHLPAAEADSCITLALKLECGPNVVKHFYDAGGRLHDRDDARAWLLRKRRMDCDAIAIAAGANVHARSKGGQTPLHHAAVPLPAHLAPPDPDADYDSGDDDSERPEQHWGHRRAADRVEVLLRAGADANAQDADGRTPLHIGLSYFAGDASERLLRAMVEYGADPAIKANTGRSWLRRLVSAVRVALDRWGDDDDDFDYWLEWSTPRTVTLLATAAAWQRRRHMLLAIRGRASDASDVPADATSAGAPAPAAPPSLIYDYQLHPEYADGLWRFGCLI